MPNIRNKLLDQFLKRYMHAQIYPGVDFPTLRKKIEKGDKLAARMDKGFIRENISFDEFTAEWIKTPTANPDQILLYFHGGGFCIRTPAIHGQFLASLCKETASTGLMPDYRLAPEHKYPTAFEDCLTSYLWLLEKGYSAKNIIVGGDSAGGTLSLALLLHLKEESLPMPACALLISPSVDPSFSGPSFRYNAKKDSVLSPGAIQAFSRAYSGKHRNDPKLALLNQDYKGLPPLIIQAGGNEILLSDSTRLASKAKQAGVDIELQIFKKMSHVFQLFSFLPEAKQARQRLVFFINKHSN